MTLSDPLPRLDDTDVAVLPTSVLIAVLVALA